MLIHHRPLAPVHALSLDLDDTLWDNSGVVPAAEDALCAWLAARVPGWAAHYPPAALRGLYPEAAAADPRCAYDMTALRLWCLNAALRRLGADPALAQPAFAHFHAERHRISLDPELPALLKRLAARWPLVAVTNGNVELVRLGLESYFTAQIAPADAGAAKPDAAPFLLACQRLGLEPARVLHVGDDLRYDVAGALDAGLQAAWFNPRGLPAPTGLGAQLELSRLDELLELP
ncbi:MAG: HAD-IA family hydrolase [Gammaproteobacteria bacterium]|nr:HAD-IA family hydrolase [Gammaproteobacteria bacterium]